jgi:probable phosphoglycerate mutase
MSTLDLEISVSKESTDLCVAETDAGSSGSDRGYSCDDLESLASQYDEFSWSPADGCTSADAMQFLVPAPAYTARALLVRHGETDFNSQGRIQGTLESVLTDEGREQAGELGAWLAATKDGRSVDRVIVSPKVRTVETLAEIEAAFTAAAHPLPAREARFDLREIELTDWQGMRRQEIQKEDAAAWDVWKKEPMNFVFPKSGFAPLQDLWTRAGSEWEHLRDCTDGSTTLVVAHGAFNRCFVAQALGLPIESFLDDHFDFCNCECVEMEWSNTGDLRWRRRNPRLTEWITLDEERLRFAGHGGVIKSKQYEEPGSSKGA